MLIVGYSTRKVDQFDSLKPSDQLELTFCTYISIYFWRLFLYKYSTKSWTKSKRSHTMMSGSWSVSLASYKEKNFHYLVLFSDLSRQIQLNLKVQNSMVNQITVYYFLFAICSKTEYSAHIRAYSKKPSEV